MPHPPAVDRSPPAEILAWPGEAERREHLAATGVPRLLVLEQGELPPTDGGPLEDWIWLPATEQDVFARLQRLASRRQVGALEAGDVVVDADGTAHAGGRSVVLAPAEAAILGVLAERLSQVCSRESLAEAAWGDVPHARRSLDSRVFTLRRRIEPLGLTIVAVRGRGFVLTPAGGGSW